ncbi:mitochondrial ATP synthase B chain precursor domain-containing protein [Ditylenchus destructor]|uniref:ATP synthase subunit b n=1 Tax=Ditylenchus destructor TaxID=166010 RepID=A0AAD4MYA7_9BILA|nr:mitochondrial ATP synthase B chain precursor domain-containing protein [Ditylenchus destructor]
MVLSRLILQQGAISKANIKSFSIVHVRCQAAPALPATQSDVGQTLSSVEEDRPGFFARVIARWNGIPLKGETHAPEPTLFKDCDKLFYPPEPLPPIPKDYKEHPERDLVNFPYPETHMFAPKFRLFMIPDSWCTPFHKITGTSGPYLFWGGLAAFLVSKEIFTLDEGWAKLYCGIWAYLLISRTWSYQWDKKLYQKWRDEMDMYNKLIAEDLKEAVEFRNVSAAEAESLKAMQENFPTIFKENMALQLEAAYRQNVEKVSTELKRRIDYLQEVEDTKTRFERDILLQSVIEGVQKQIATNEGNIKDAYLDNCIDQLKTLRA